MAVTTKGAKVTKVLSGTTVLPWMPGEKAKRLDGTNLITLLRRMPRYGEGMAVRKLTWDDDCYLRIAKIHPRDADDKRKRANVQAMTVFGGHRKGGIRDRSNDPGVNHFRRPLWVPLSPNYLDVTGVSGWRKGPLSAFAFALGERTTGRGFIKPKQPRGGDTEEPSESSGEGDEGADNEEAGGADVDSTSSVAHAVWWSHPAELTVDRTSVSGWKRGSLSFSAAALEDIVGR